ncbi:MAG: dienelactone hydrolase family protein [Chromatiales bacterium]|nr:dienelactone hydrolase family protein [Chromatiales bacterium]
MKRIVLGLTLICLSSLAQAGLVGKEVEYTQGGKVFKGYVAYDDAVKEKRPGVLVVHEWWGHNDYARRRADMLAELGYTALAVDMYGDGKRASHPKDAGKFASEVKKNMNSAAARFQAGINLLKQHQTVSASDISAIGYCFGGGIVLEMARRGMDLDAVASFHGSLKTNSKAKPGVVKARVLVFNGAADPFVKPEEIESFKAEMNQAGVNYTFTNHPGAKHSFTNPAADEMGKRFDIPLAYNAEADKASWNTMKQVFAEIYQR